ncbi:hypothetical protein ACQPW3_19360 [Actinosynnema sp. CA-248983]
MCLYRMPAAAAAIARQGNPPKPEPTVPDIPDRAANEPPAREAAAA